MASITSGNLLAQSQYLYLQNAGSDGSDGSAPGVHLRWDLLGALGDLHIPKGNLAAAGSAYATTVGFNKSNDFVKLYRTRYNRNFPIVIDFASMAPTEIVDNGAQKAWKYKGITPIASLPSNTCDVIVRFTNPYRYEEVKRVCNPATNRLGFLKKYKQLIEIEVEGRLMFSAYVHMQAIDEQKENVTRLESISLTENSASGSLFVSSRKKYAVQGGVLTKEDLAFLLLEDEGAIDLEEQGSGNRKLTAENIKYLRLMGTNCFPSMLWLETYEDFMLGKNQTSDWEEVVDLSLSLNESQVFDRLAKSSTYEVDNNWPRYVDGQKVKVDNYIQKWSNTEDEYGTVEGLRTGVEKYLEYSRDANNLDATNPKTCTQAESPYCGGAEDEEIVYAENSLEEEFQFSYLQMLKLVSLDFHVARMLGFGYIDSSVDEAFDSKYVYMAVYDTNMAVGSNTPIMQKHTYMALPIGKKDNKLPFAPKLDELSYGMYADSGDGEKRLISDENGYFRFEKSRAINLSLTPNGAPYPLGDFFVPDEEYSYAEHTMPIMYGLKYRDAEATIWTDLSVDKKYRSYNGAFEIMPIFGKEENPIYTHLEKNEGEHEYAMYGINWFSRASTLSNEVQTDVTEFNVVETVIPPLNFAVQLIQPEDVLMFTTEAEQLRLQGIAGDKTLVRLTYDWNDVQAANYWTPTPADPNCLCGMEAEFFFRTEEMNFVRGKIKSVTKIDNKLYEIRTKAYEINSSKDISTVMPTIPVGTETRYIGSLLTTKEGQFVVQGATQSSVAGEGPVFTVTIPKDTSLIDADLANEFVVAEAEIWPEQGSVFAVAENTMSKKSWASPLSQKFPLFKFSEHAEEVEYADGQKEMIHVGGICSTANIVEAKDKRPKLDAGGNYQYDINGDLLLEDIEGSITGIFTITFNQSNLLPDLSVNYPNLEFHKGKVRIMSEDGSIMKHLNVVQIKTLADGKVELKVVDPTFELAMEGSYEISPNYKPIKMGVNVNVNFHPSYRAYLTVESGVFDENTILPIGEFTSKQTYMACRAVDSINKAESFLTTPAILYARKVIEPIAPGVPDGPQYATRPDFYGKATWTFDSEVKTTDRDPYMLLFFRATGDAILNALYSSTIKNPITNRSTLEQVRADLAALGSDEWFTNRWNGLVNMDMDSSKQFKEYQGYRFPNPDNEKFQLPDASLKYTIKPFLSSINPGSDAQIPGSEKIFGGAGIKYCEAVKLAIEGSFCPLTEQPIVYEYIKNGTQTLNQKPIIKDSQGQMISTSDASFNPFPMAVKYTDGEGRKVRFTDYTLDGASNAFVFYYGMELTDTFKVSEASGISGPIKLVNTAAPKAPEVRKFYPQTENVVNVIKPAIVFEINEYSEVENISHIQIFRTTDSVKAANIRLMDALEPIPVKGEIIDDFIDLDYCPFGESIYYKLVAIRTVKNEFDEDEVVYSMPSATLVANVIDVVNPLAPTIYEYSKDEINSTDELYKGVQLKWHKTVHNGLYHIYQMSRSGNWSKIGELADNSANLEFALPFDLAKVDDEGIEIFHRFKIVAENSSGLLSLNEQIITI